MGKKKEHTPLPEGEWKFKRQRNGDTHITACNSGYPKAAMGKTPRWLEVHHLLCVHACSDSTFPEDADATFLKNCLAITPWCINDHTYPVGEGESNVIGLPTKQAYVSDKTPAWDQFPCHQVDHDIYLDDVNKYVTAKIWKALAQAKEEEACEQLTPENIKAKFTTASKKWRAHLVTRGKCFGGTKACLDYCFKGKPHPIINDQNWHIPFSMALNEATIRQRVKPKSKAALVREALLAAIK
jgi:hypothetical protein